MIRLGLDVFSLRSQGLSPFEQLDFCAAHGVEVVHFSEPRLIGGLDPAQLQRVRAHADRLGIHLEIGMLSMCPGSSIFDASLGTAEDQLLCMLDAARIVGSPIVRCVVGRFTDRARPGGIESLIVEAVAVLKNVRSRFEDANVGIAIENHAGDMQARELKALIEEAGPPVVGACLDSGNALWALEDPHLTLETLAPYVLTSHTRDGAVRRTAEGIEVAWTRMGAGNVRIADYVGSFVEKCPGRPLTLEVIVMPAPRPLAFRDPAFWDAYRTTPAWEFQRFLELVDAAPPVLLPTGAVSAADELQNVVASLAWASQATAHRT